MFYKEQDLQLLQSALLEGDILMFMKIRINLKRTVIN